MLAITLHTLLIFFVVKSPPRGTMRLGWVLLLACAFAPRAGSRQVLYRPMNSASFVAHQEMPVHCLHARCSPLPNDVVRVLQKRNPG